VDVDVVVLRTLDDRPEQIAVGRHAVAHAVRSAERAREQRDDHRAELGRRTRVDVRGEHLAVDVRPRDVEADLLLTRVQAQRGGAARVRVPGPRNLGRSREGGRERPSAVVGGREPGHRERGYDADERDETKSHLLSFLLGFAGVRCELRRGEDIAVDGGAYACA
jgi:hypothetical protein